MQIDTSTPFGARAAARLAGETIVWLTTAGKDGTPHPKPVWFLVLDDGETRTKAEVVRTHARGARWIMSIRFLDIQERDQDRVRRRVFRALREERARQAEPPPPRRRG